MIRQHGAIILAGGQGTKPDGKVPKCLVELAGQTILERQWQVLKKCGIDAITVVIGQDGVWNEDSQHQVRDLVGDASVITNLKSLSTSSVASLYLALERVSGNTIVLDGDLVFAEGTLEVLLATRNVTTILVKEEPFGDGARVAIEAKGRDGYRVTGISRSLKSNLVYAGVLKMAAADLELFQRLTNTQRANTSGLESVLQAMLSETRVDSLKLVNTPDGEELLEIAHMAGGSFSKTAKVARTDTGQVTFRKEVVSQGAEKLADEIEWLTTLPEDIKVYFPQVSDYFVNTKPTFVEMTCYDLPSLRTLILEGTLSPAQATSWICRVLSFLFDKVYPQDRRDAPPEYIREVHLGRIYSRLVEMRHKHSLFRELIDPVELTINNVKHQNILSLIERINANSELLRYLSPTWVCRTHGDLHFDNILIDAGSEKFILVDPRGTLDYDPTYDIGKIWHSCNSFYDLLHSRNFSVDIQNRQIDYVITNPSMMETYLEIRDAVLEWFQSTQFAKEEPNWKLQSQFSEAAHMCSVLPFHAVMDGKDELAIALYSRGVELLSQFCSQLPTHLSLPAGEITDVININTDSDYEQLKSQLE